MTNLTIVGAQWGDEGKGKIVDYFSNKFEINLESEINQENEENDKIL